MKRSNDPADLATKSESESGEDTRRLAASVLNLEELVEIKLLLS